MKSKLRVLLHASPFLLLASQLPADEHVHSKNVPAVTAKGSLVQIESARATELMGQVVHNSQGAPLAKINDFVIDLENGRIVQVVLAEDGKTELRREVPPRTFGYTASNNGRVIQWRGDATKYSNAPRFSPPGSNRPGQAVHAAEVYSYYGEDPYFVVSDTSPKQPNNVHTHSKVDSSAPALVPMGRVILASDLIGLTVKDSTDEKVGTIDDLIIDVPAGRVVALVVGSGGFLGMGDSLSALPPSTIRYVSDDKDELRVTVSKDTIKQAPRYKKTDADRFNDVTYTDNVYRSYSVDPYSTIADADNTRRNVRDRNNATLTPLDQSNAAPDLAITANIRKDIVSREDLSTNAKNVKIITRDGMVTLRGPVKTASEKRTIEAIAIREAGATGRVDNQLEVTTN
ncbi:MAG: PRC-barrel domain-containing protein [Rariglobus sp.]